MYHPIMKNGHGSTCIGFMRNTMVVLIRKRIKNETRYKIRPTHFGLVYISLNSFAFRTNSLPFSTCSTNSPNCRGILYAR